MGVLGSCLILLSCWGGTARSERRGPGREPSTVFRCLLSGLCKSWRRAGLKGDGGKTGEWEGFSSLTTPTFDLCSYRNTQITPLTIKHQRFYMLEVMCCYLSGSFTCFLCDGDWCPIAWNWGMWVEGISRGEGLSRKQPTYRTQNIINELNFLV